MRDDIPPETLRRVLRYDPDTGRLFWLPREVFEFPDQRAWASWTTSYCGKEALTASTSGYRNGSILGGNGYRAHRVAWAIYYGEWPTRHVDHINGDKSDNRLSNLRLVTPSENQKNRTARSMAAKSSRYKGVHWRTERERWVAEIHADGRTRRIGSFRSEDDAARAYNDAAMASFGSFARLNEV